MDASEDLAMSEQMIGGDCLNQARRSPDLNLDREEVCEPFQDCSTSFKQKNDEFGKEQACSSAALEPENAKLFKADQRYKEQCTRLQGQLKILLEDLRVARSEVVGLEEEKEDLTRCLCRDAMEARRLLEEKREELADLTNRYKKENSLLCDVEAQLSSAKSEMEFVVGDQRQKLLSAEKELDRLRNERDRLAASYQATKEENVRLKAKVDAQSERIGSLQNDVMYSSSQWEARKLEGENQSAIVLALETMEKEHRTTTEDQERRNSELQGALAKTKDQLKVCELARSILEEDVVRFQSLVSSLQDKIFMTETSQQKAEEMVRGLVESKAALKIKLDLAEERLDVEKEIQREADGRITDLLEQVKEAEEVLMRTKEHVSKQAEDMEDLVKNKYMLEGQIKNLEEENRKLEQRLLKKRNCIETLQAELKDIKQENEKMRHQITKSADDKIHLKEELQESAVVHSKEETLKKLWTDEVVSRSMLGLRVAHIEREKQTVVRRMKRERRKQRKALRLKEAVDRELKLEQQRNLKLRRKLNRIKTRLAIAQKERMSVLNSVPNKMAVKTKDSESHIQKQVQMEGVLSELKELLSKHGILQTDVQKLRGFVSDPVHRDVEPRENPAETKSQWQDGEMRRKTTDSNEEDRTFYALFNWKLEEINSRLVEQAAAREQAEKLRDANHAAVRTEFQRIKDNLKRELLCLHNENLELESQRDSAVKESETFQRLYKDERTQHLDTLAALEAAKTRLFKRHQQECNFICKTI